MSAFDETPDASVLAVIRVEEAHREAVMRDLLNLGERSQKTAEVLSKLQRIEDSLAALRERRAHLEAGRTDQ